MRPRKLCAVATLQTYPNSFLKSIFEEHAPARGLSCLSLVQGADVVAADRFGNFYVVPGRGAVDPGSQNSRGGVTIEAGANDFNPEVIKVLNSLALQYRVGLQISVIVSGAIFGAGIWKSDR